jgi:hypothetical protein
MPLTQTRFHHPSRLPEPGESPRTGGVLVVVGGDEVPDWAVR